ncbi:MAG TPA: glycosyltransferase [Nitrososphaera sp.]|nr:glycosyltransferase [Nitrososphaera sp.]
MIDLCVVNFQTKDKLERLLEVLHQDLKTYDPPWNLYIAENGSTDGSADFLAEEEWRYSIKHIDFNDNIGYANACNKLASYGSAPILGLLNADVWMTTGDVNRIARAFADPDVAILGPKQRNEYGEITHAGIFGTLTKPAHRGWREPDPLDEKYRDHLEAITVSGSAYFVRRSIWELLTICPTYTQWHAEIYQDKPEGAFLPTEHYYEESWTSWHAHAHNLKVYYHGYVSIGHTWHASHEIGSPQDQLFRKSQAIFRSACDYHNIPRD